MKEVGKNNGVPFVIQRHKISLQNIRIVGRSPHCSQECSFKPQGGHTSISLTGMLVQEQISITQKSRMTPNSNPKKIECPKIQTQKNRMTQDAMFVEVRINMKSYYDFDVFQYCVFFMQRIQVCDTKIGRPKK